MIAVWFSCGAASAAALNLTLERFPGEDVRAVNQPIAEEHADNRRFLRDVAEWCGVEIEEFSASKYPAASAVEVWDRRKAMVFPHGAPCTVHLKKEARQEWEAINRPDWHVLGFTAEEQDRHERFTQTERSNVIPVLIDAAMTKADCGDMVRGPASGYPRSTTWGCRTRIALGAARRRARLTGTLSAGCSPTYSPPEPSSPAVSACGWCAWTASGCFWTSYIRRRAASQCGRCRLAHCSARSGHRQHETRTERIEPMSRCDDCGIVGRKPTLGKHRANNSAHLRAVIERLDAAGDHEAADTIAWLIWHQDLDRERERYLTQQNTD